MATTHEITRMTGLASGLDIESLVKAGVANTKNSLDTRKQKLQTLQWKQEAYRNIISAMSDFKKTYLNIESSTSIRANAVMKSNKAESSDSSLIVAASTSAVPGKYSITSVQAAKEATLSGTKASAGTVELDFSKASAGSNTVTVNGRSLSGEVTLRQGTTYVPLRLVAEALGCTAEWDPYMDGAAVTGADSPYDAVDLYWLSRVIYAESGAEPMAGQIAVGNVVLNRVASREFPNSVAEVVFDRKHGVQFEPVSNGTIYNTPSAASVEAAKRAMDGERVVGDALYFYAPNLSQGLWITANRTYLTTIGCHRFYL